MATNYLNNLNNSIKINSSLISNADSTDALLALSKRNAGDLNRLADYINAILVPGLSSLCSKPTYPYDAVESGISGLTIVTYPAAQGNTEFNSPLYWVAGQNESDGRPCTIKESFDYLLSNMVDRVVEVRESVTNLNPVLDQILCSNKNIIRVAKDSFGEKYAAALNCNTDSTKNYALGEHIYQIISQLTNNSVADDLATGSSSYPTLSIPSLNLVVATETTKGVSEIASIQDIAQGAGLNDSDTSSELVVTADRLAAVLETDDANGNLTGINNLRNKVKTIADEQIALANIEDLANVSDSPSASEGNILLYQSGSWKAGNINASSILGDKNTDPTVSDLTGRPLSNGDVIVYDHLSEENVRTRSYNTSGLNFNYYKSTDKEWSKVAGVTVDATLRTRAIPFVLKCGPAFGVFDEATMLTVNSSSILSPGGELGLLSPGLNKSKSYAFYQNTTNVWDTLSAGHNIDVHKILGVCRSDLNYGKTWVATSSNQLTGNVTNEFLTYIDGSIGDACIQEYGTSQVMVLGPYSVGDKIYLCPGKILDMTGIRNNIGICISETFMESSITSLTDGVTTATESLFALFRRETATTTGVNVANQLEIESRPIGIITNKYNTNFDFTTSSNNKINLLCYNLVNASYDSSASNSYISYINTEVLEIDSSASLFDSSYQNFLKRSVELSLPMVKLTL